MSTGSDCLNRETKSQDGKGVLDVLGWGGREGGTGEAEADRDIPGRS